MILLSPKFFEAVCCPVAHKGKSFLQYFFQINYFFLVKIGQGEQNLFFKPDWHTSACYSHGLNLTGPGEVGEGDLNYFTSLSDPYHLSETLKMMLSGQCQSWE